MSFSKILKRCLETCLHQYDKGQVLYHSTIMGLSPVPAVNNLLKNTDIGMEDFELIEVNEAFAAQYIRMRMPL